MSKTVTNLIADYRYAQMYLRRLRRVRADGLATTANLNAYARHTEAVEGIERELIPAHRELVGLLIEEANLRERLRKADNPRPDLEVRQLAASGVIERYRHTHGKVMVTALVSA